MFNKNPDVYFQLVGNQPEYAPHIHVTRYALTVSNNFYFCIINCVPSIVKSKFNILLAFSKAVYVPYLP